MFSMIRRQTSLAGQGFERIGAGLSHDGIYLFRKLILEPRLRFYALQRFYFFVIVYFSSIYPISLRKRPLSLR